MASWCTTCGMYHWAGGCATREPTPAQQIHQTYALLEQAFWLAAAMQAREFAKLLRGARAERGTDR